MSTHRWFLIKVVVGLAPLIAATSPVLSQTSSPRDVLVRFSELDARGEQLTPEGWQKVAALFVTPGTPRLDKVTVVKDFVVSHPALQGKRAEFYVEYIELGRIDPSQARFSDINYLKVRAGFYVIGQSGLGTRGPASQVEGPVDWRIEGPVREPHLTVDAAIRYATELRAGAKDGATKKNADRMLAALKRLR